DGERRRRQTEGGRGRARGARSTAGTAACERAAEPCGAQRPSNARRRGRIRGRSGAVGVRSPVVLPFLGRHSVPPSKRASRKRGTQAKSPQVGEYDGGRTLPHSAYVRVGPLRLSLRVPVLSTVASAGRVGFPAEVIEMRALLRSLFVGALSVAIAAAGLFGSSSTALTATGPRITTWSVT